MSKLATGFSAATLEAHLRSNRQFKAEKFAHIFNIPEKPSLNPIEAVTEVVEEDRVLVTPALPSPTALTTTSTITSVIREIKRVARLEPGSEVSKPVTTQSTRPIQRPRNDDGGDTAPITKQLFNDTLDRLFDVSEPRRDVLLNSF